LNVHFWTASIAAEIAIGCPDLARAHATFNAICERTSGNQRWSSADGGLKEIVRQQWNFSPAGATSEVEDYEVDLDGVSALELAIKPDLTRREAPATLASWRVA
jgi:hypothetical protein